MAVDAANLEGRGVKNEFTQQVLIANILPIPQTLAKIQKNCGGLKRLSTKKNHPRNLPVESTFAGPELTTVPAYELLGWEYYHETNMCYKKFRVAGGGNQDVKESEKNCTGYGGNLASIHSAAQNNFLQHMLPIAPCVIGLKFVENQCGVAHRYWSDSSVVNFENWEPGEPNNNMCEQFCTYLQSDGTWNNYRCDANSAFVCETDNIVYCPQRRT
ncbi:hypothetical protein RB195_008521 [Necator americanus]|uniref:C-type lectin domain-containing protein n=1 Tax=Necator americanus TaxID=51031 RepID=A0ABR1CRN8_NECAM